ncbi:MAG: hypothetical protein J1E41_00205 [Ruminococcus sp.]|nr:hypothetical protein [Ruminococcus sp.]
MKKTIFTKLISVLLIFMLCISAVVGTGLLSANAVSATVYLRGTFNGWEAPAEYAMQDDGNGHCLITVHLDAGTHEYKAATEDWSTLVIPSGDNESVTLAQDSDVTFVADVGNYTVTAYIHSNYSSETELNRVVIRTQWMEHSDEVLTLSGDRVSYASENGNYEDNAYWNIIPAKGDYFYIQNDNTKGYMYLNGSEVYCSEDGNSTDAGLWKIDVSTGNKRIINATNDNAVINVENQDGYAQATGVPIYYTSSQWTFEYTHYEYTLNPDSVSDTGYNAYADSPTSITSYATGSKRTWRLSKNLSAQPAFSAPNTPLAAAVYNLTMEETLKSIHTDNYGDVFYTGTLWQKVWTRDTAMSNLYSLSWVFPEITYNCQREKIKTSNGISVFEEDTGTGGSYPVSTDKIITMLSVWETYLADGNTDHLSYFYDVCYNTIMQDMEVAYDKDAELFKGETCGLDWRDQTYPDWTSETYDSGLNNIAEGKTTSVNAIYCRVLEIMSQAAKVLNKGEATEKYWAKMASDLKEKISSRLWNDNLNLYSAWEYPEYMGSVLAEKADVLGNGFALWFNVGTDEQLKAIGDNYPLVTYGAPTVYPQKQGTLANAEKIYHNFGVWPGWEAALMVGAAYSDNEALAEEIFNSTVRGAATSLTQKEVINYLTGEGVASDQQLWSIAGTLAGYYRVLFGMNYDEDGISFDPYIPSWMKGPFTLTNYKYRGSNLNITLSGEGDQIVSFTVDGNAVDKDYVFPVNSTGSHTIQIVLGDSGVKDTINKGDKNLVIAPKMPTMNYSNGTLRWTSDSSLTYKLWDGSKYIDVKGNSYKVDTSVYGCYCLMSISADGICSELSRPIVVSPDKVKVEAESGTMTSTNLIKRSVQGYSGTGYVVDNRSQSANLEIKVNIPKSGKYLMSAIYNNPGDATSGTSCAIRSVCVDGVDQGTIYFPEVYSEHTFQLSTHLSLNLKAGIHTVKIFYDTANWYDRNMNISKNNVEYDYFDFDYVGEGEFDPDETEPPTTEPETTEAPTTEAPTTEPPTSEPTSSTATEATSTEPSSSTETTLPSLKIGDADQNGVVDINDVTYIQKYLAKFSGYTCTLDTSDTSKDGLITIVDATLIQKFIAGIIPSLG